MFRFSVERKIGESRKCLVEDGSHLHSSKVANKSKMWTRPKGDVLIWNSLNIELVGVFKHLRVAISARVVDDYFVAFADLRVSEL